MIGIMEAVKRTPKQKQRQSPEYREGGKYAKVNPCYRCGKSAGIDYYSFHADARDDLGNEWHDRALCLCKKCCGYLERLEAGAAWYEATSSTWGQFPQGRPK